MVYSYRTRQDGRKFRFSEQPEIDEMIDHILAREPTPFEREVDAILSGEKDFYLEWQKKIVGATSDDELRGLVREILDTEYSDSAKKIILQLVDRQYDLIREIKGGGQW